MELDYYILPNRNNFNNFINSKFTLATKADENIRKPIKIWNGSNYNDIQPFHHQKFVSDYLNENTPYRSLLLYHGLGSGKSGASILIGEGFSKRTVVILLPASIRSNYISEIKKFGKIAYKENFYWQFIDLGEIDLVNESIYENYFTDLGIEKALYKK